MTLPRIYNTSITESHDTEMEEVSLNLITDFIKEYSNMQLNEARKPIQNLDKEVSNMGGKNPQRN
jgi:hypothetical protein